MKLLSSTVIAKHYFYSVENFRFYCKTFPDRHTSTTAVSMLTSYTVQPDYKQESRGSHFLLVRASLTVQLFFNGSIICVSSIHFTKYPKLSYKRRVKIISYCIERRTRLWNRIELIIFLFRLKLFFSYFIFNTTRQKIKS